MYEEQRLISIGYPFSEAASICNSMRKAGEDLETFIIDREKEYRQMCAEIVREVMD